MVPKLETYITATPVATTNIPHSYNKKNLTNLLLKGPSSAPVIAKSVTNPTTSVILFLISDGPVWLAPINNLDFAQKLVQMMEDKNFKL